mgnify:CR=1 FL=1
MKKFLTVALAGVLAASMLFTGCSKKEESKVPDKLIVGTNAEFPPFEYMNDKKQPDGFDIAMIKETSILGYLAIVDLTKVSDFVISRIYQALAPLLGTALIYYVIVKILTLGLNALERRLRQSDRR